MRDQVGARAAGLSALAVLTLLFLAFFFRAMPIGLDPARSNQTPDQFDTARALDRLGRVLGDETPHPVDSDALDVTRGRLLAEIEALGYAPEVHDQTACRGSISGSAIRCARVQNITFAAGPLTGPTLVLTAHYDSVDASPGAGDDGIGVAVWLEVAHHLKHSPPGRPVLFLMTDGEETALLGAQAFVDASAYGRDVDRIINLEARGVRGPAMMFETSHPNSQLVADWSRSATRPLANSMMAAVYELLPNSTDLTVYLQAGWKGINIAISDGVDFYHTQRDDLAMLDPRSVQHMGDQALSATRDFLTRADAPAGEVAYSDIASRVFITLPQTVALIMLGLAFGASALLVMRPARIWDWKSFDWRAFVLPPALIVTSGVLAFASAWLLGAIRVEPAFWVAYPQALNCVIFLSTLFAAALGLTFVAPASRREALFASGWFWFLVIGMGLSFVVPGMSMTFLMPGIVFVLMAIVARVYPRWMIGAHAVAAMFLLLVFLPLIHLVDVMMGLGLAALFGVLEAITLAPILSLIGPIARPGRIVFATLGAAYAVAFATTALLPAFSLDRPLGLNFVGHFDMDRREATLTASAPPGALPDAVRSQLTVQEAVRLPGVTAILASRPLAFVERTAADMIVETDSLSADGRTLGLRLAAAGARQIRLRIPASARPTRLTREGAANPIAMRAPQDGYYIFDCVGRACDGARLTLTLAPPPADAAPAEPDPWLIQGYWPGLPEEAAPVSQARPDAALQIQAGDVTVTTRRATP